jgi:hypothetical protein
MGLDKAEFWWRILRFNWFGHQSRFDLPPKVALGRTLCITGHWPAFSTSFPPTFLSYRGCVD